MPGFKIKAAAKADLKNIARYTEQAWGRDKRNQYLADFDNAFKQLSLNTQLGTNCDHIKSGYRVLQVSSHLIFYKIADNNYVEIIRALHKRMNISARIPDSIK